MGCVGAPGSALYCASKFALVGLAESIYYDLAEHGISVSCINPGIVASEIRSVNNQGEYTGKPDPTSTRFRMPTDRAARQIVRGLYRRTPEFVITKHGKVVTFAVPHFPRTMRALVRVASKGRLEKIECRKRGNTNEG
jgi:short-subunit dehydrogenase